MFWVIHSFGLQIHLKGLFFFQFKLWCFNHMYFFPLRIPFYTQDWELHKSLCARGCGRGGGGRLYVAGAKDFEPEGWLDS